MMCITPSKGQESQTPEVRAELTSGKSGAQLNSFKVSGPVIQPHRPLAPALADKKAEVLVSWEQKLSKKAENFG